MTSQYHQIEYGNYGFHFINDMLEPAAQIESTGLEIRTSADYYFHGLKRNEKDRYLIQYTLSGRGTYIFNNEVYNITKGQAILVQIPGNHSYFLPKDSPNWEFIYIMLYGSEIKKYWRNIFSALGPAPKFEIDSPVVQILFSICKDVATKKIKDPYRASGAAYQILMELYRYSKMNSSKEYPELINKAISLLIEKYDKNYGVAELAGDLGVSKYYLIRQFSKFTRVSPGKYLSKIRMEKAVELLNHTELSIEEIASKIGYSNGNYFIKVFKNYFNMSPGAFRQEKKLIHYKDFIL